MKVVNPSLQLSSRVQISHSSLSFAGETDWKVVTIDVNDPVASQMNDITDIDKFFPGLLKASIEWFKVLIRNSLN